MRERKKVNLEAANVKGQLLVEVCRQNIKLEKSGMINK